MTIPAVIVPDLRSHIEWFAEPGPLGRVFIGPKGATPRRSNFNRIWQKALQKAKVDGLHLHDLRHTGNTLAALTGASLRELMERAGHSSSRAALGYLHAVKARDRAIADGLSDLVRRTRGGEAEPETGEVTTEEARCRLTGWHVCGKADAKAAQKPYAPGLQSGA